MYIYRERERERMGDRQREGGRQRDRKHIYLLFKAWLNSLHK